jgi:hypothetical protein
MSSKDSNKYRKSRPDVLSRKCLLPSAVPSIFPNLPHYFNKSVPAPRSETSTKESRFKKQADALEDASAKFLEADHICSLQELNQKLDRQCLPKGLLELVSDEKITFLSVKEDARKRPTVLYSLTVLDSLQFSMWCHDIEIAPSKVSHISKDEKLSSCSRVLNIVAFLRNLSDEKELPVKYTVEHCVSLMTLLASEVSDDVAQKISFLAEQLSISILSAHQRRYSPGNTLLNIELQHITS